MAYAAIDNLPAVHPGEILADQLEALDISATRLALHINVPPNYVTEIVRGRRGVSAEMALRLGKAFGTGERFWMDLQSTYETKHAMEELREKVGHIEPLVPA